MSKYALIDLKGGLGNQLFQISFAHYLRSHGYKIYFDTSFFYNTSHPFPRELGVNLDLLEYKNVNLKSNFIFKINKSIFLEDHTFSISELKRYNRFSGYYQNFKYLEYSKSLLVDKLKLINNDVKENIAAIHIRKTDYKIINQELSEGYYESAIFDLLNRNKELKFDIFTDDNNLFLNKKIFKNINNIYKPIPNEKSIDTLKKMLNYKYYIIANSSLSAIAAFLSEKEDKVVFYPEPWWRNSEIKLTNIPSKWMSIINK